MIIPPFTGIGGFRTFFQTAKNCTLPQNVSHLFFVSSIYLQLPPPKIWASSSIALKTYSLYSYQKASHKTIRTHIFQGCKWLTFWGSLKHGYASKILQARSSSWPQTPGQKFEPHHFGLALILVYCTFCVGSCSASPELSDCPGLNILHQKKTHKYQISSHIFTPVVLKTFPQLCCAVHRQ